MGEEAGARQPMRVIRCPLAGALAVLGLAGSSGAAAQRFTEVTESSGVRFHHRTGRGEAGRPAYSMPEIMGSGVGLYDFDGDSDHDLYFVQGSGPDQLFENLGGLHFAEVPRARQPPLLDGRGAGIAVGDFDNDGDLDLFRTGYGADALLRNDGGESGAFAPGDPPEGQPGWDRGWSASATFCDYDSDGWLDLFVTRYLDYDPDFSCHAPDGRQDYCSPTQLRGRADLLYRNDRGRFRDRSEASGIAAFSARGLGVVCHDFTGDGRLDFFVANDTEANHLWVNQGDGTFAEEALLLGAALSGFGRPEAGMGVDLGDLDGDGDLDLLLTHFADETNTAYLAEPGIGFTDSTISLGLGMPGLRNTGFGVALADWNHDGHLDAVVANGRVARPAGEGPQDPFFAQYSEPALVLGNDGRRFRDRTGESPALLVPTVGRGLAAGDLDGDGDLDLVLTANAGPARIFRNDSEHRGRPLLITALAAEGRSDHGAVVQLVTRAGRRTARVNPGVSYLSSGDPRAHFGVPEGTRIEEILVRWSDGFEERFPPPESAGVTLLRGRGKTDG